MVVAILGYNWRKTRNFPWESLCLASKCFCNYLF